MKPSLYLLIPALFLVSCDQQEVATTTLAAPASYDDCITQTMQGVSSDVAARAIIESCQNQFASEPEEVVDASRLVTRSDTVYEINSDTPFTGVSSTYHENGQVDERITFKDGKLDGLVETYRQNGELIVSRNFKDGKQVVEGAVAFSDVVRREDWVYEIGSDTPYTGTVVSHHENGLIDHKGYFKGGKLNGLYEQYSVDGTLESRWNYKDGELDGIAEIYYESNKEDFIDEENLVVRYVILDKDEIAEEIEVDEAELKAQYESEREEYEGSSEKRAAHILFEVGVDLTEAAALTLARETQQQILEGEDFEALALELSSDIVSAKEGGDIGYTDGSAFPSEIEEALEILALNEVSDPIITEFGVHLVKLTEDTENFFQPYEEVVDRIERDKKRTEIELIYAERLHDLSNLAFETGDLLTISEELNLPILQSEPIGRSGGSAIFSNQELIAVAFSDEVLMDGNNSDVVELGAGQAVVLRINKDETLQLRMDYKDGELDGITEIYNKDGTLQQRENYKDGELLGRCDEPGCTDFN